MTIDGWIDLPDKEQARAFWGHVTYVEDLSSLFSRGASKKGDAVPGLVVGNGISAVFLPLSQIKGIAVCGAPDTLSTSIYLCEDY